MKTAFPVRGLGRADRRFPDSHAIGRRLHIPPRKASVSMIAGHPIPRRTRHGNPADACYRPKVTPHRKSRVRLTWPRGLLLTASSLAGLAVLLAGGYCLFVLAATKFGVASLTGTRSGLAVDGPVTIARDARGIPHLRASTDHDLYFADGYAMAQDRLFQMDLTRRYVEGRLAEMLGAPLAATDRRMRLYGIRQLAERIYAGSSPDEKGVLTAFADGVNAAASSEPVPAEYRALLLGFERWQPQDAIAVGFATVLDLDDRADQIATREWVHEVLGQAGTDAFYPLTDPRYDVPTDGEPRGGVPPLPPLPGAHAVAALPPVAQRGPIGSNAWVVGGDRTTSGRAVLANDPHLDLGVPAIWWLMEGRSPHLHIAGAALAGTPGVTLGHDEHVAWGVTAGETATMRLVIEPMRGADTLLEGGRWLRAHHRVERIGVRFGRAVDEDVLETAHGVVLYRGRSRASLMDWGLRREPISPLTPFVALNRARSIGDALDALRTLREPVLNVVLADDTGRAAYQLAGGIPVEAAWGRYGVDGSGGEPPVLPFDRAPHVAPSRDALVVSSNNRADGAGGPRLAPFWVPPYRAFEVHRALEAARDARGKLSVAAIAGVQRDDNSPAELEFARDVLGAATREHADRDASLAPLLAALRTFDGAVVPASRGATAVVALRLDAVLSLAAAHLPAELAQAYANDSSTFDVVLRALRERPRGWVLHDDYDAFLVASLRHVQEQLGPTVPAFGTWAPLKLEHPLAPFGFRLWNGATFPGHGGSFAPAVQWNKHGQSFRAVWSPGDWDAGTIDIDAGESGEPGSAHYGDESPGWARFARTTLPFSDRAVKAATRTVLTLTR
jgi:penicillin amidase